MIVTVLAGLLLHAAATGSPAAAPQPPVSAAPTADSSRAAPLLRDFMAHRRMPGLSVAVGRHGRLVWAQGFGVADLATSAPVTQESVFPIGSTSKVLTSLALGQLVEAGKLDLDAPIQTYVDFPRKAHPLTARLLAGHLSGIRNYDVAAGEYANQRAFGSVTEALTVFRDDSLLFEPGTQYAYSAYNFVLLAAIIEGASKRDFLGYVREHITSPLGLERTGPDRRDAPARGRVTPYVAGWGGIPAPAPPIDSSNKWAAGGYVSTPTDMVRLGNAILAGKVVSDSTFALLTTPQRLKNGEGTGDGYAMGWRSGTRRFAAVDRELRVVHHGGTANGAMSFFVLLPEAGLVVALQGNLLFQPFGPFAEAAYAVAEAFLASDSVQVEP